MKQTEKTVKAVSYVAGITAIAGAVLLVFFLVLSLVGLIHPRKTRIVLYTPEVNWVYDGTAVRGNAPMLRGGSLHPGHTIELTGVPEHTKVGTYPNEPIYAILDSTGADVTDQYDITQVFGDIAIKPRPIQLFTTSQSKEYDGEALTAEPAQLGIGSLVPGHTLVTSEGNSLLFPGKEEAVPFYQIITQDGIDVTDQYAVIETFGTLEIRPIALTVTTESAQKGYDGKPLSASGWEKTAGELLEGHTLNVELTASLTDVGTVANEGIAWVTDAEGQDVSALYRVEFLSGTLKIGGIPLYITTGSAQKEYDGSPLSDTKWEITKGSLEPGDALQVCFQTVCDSVGSADNVLQFSIVSADGTDVTYRYDLICDYGTLTLQPRTICIRTDSAQKIYDGKALSCDTYTITGGSLAAGEQISISCTSITEVGYSDNYVLSIKIYRQESDGTVKNVTDCYRIVYDFGTLKITAG